MKKFVFASCVVLALASAISVRAVTPVEPEYGYVFVSDPASSVTPLNPSDYPNSTPTQWGGELFLYSSSSVSGSLLDIDLSRSWVETEYGSFYLNDPSIGSSMSLSGSFTWTASEITSMDITGVVTLDSFGYDWYIADSYVAANIEDPLPGNSDTGQWVAAPDSAATALLIALAAAGLCGFEYFSRNRPLAMARG